MRSPATFMISLLLLAGCNGDEKNEGLNADAGYEDAIATARERGVDLPMLEP